MQMTIDQILSLHKKTQLAITRGAPPQEAVYPYTMEYPALRGKTVAITWSSRTEWRTAENTIIIRGQAAYRKAHPSKGKTEGQRRWIAMAIRMGWI